MVFVRYPEIMSLFAEKMRQIGGRLKSAGERAKLKTASAAGDAARFWQKTRQRPVDWWASRRAAPASTLDGAWPDSGLDAPSRQDTAKAPAPATQATGWRADRPRLAKALHIAAIVIGAYLVLPYVLIVLFWVLDPPFSALMLRHALTGREINFEWADFKDISPNLARAAVIAEDARFCQHSGVDWNAVGEALRIWRTAIPRAAPARSLCRPRRTCSCGPTSPTCAKRWKCRSPISSRCSGRNSGFWRSI
jgi:hypothetical protein